MRVDDEEREQVVAALRKQFADGKLSLEEFGDRVEAAYGATTSEDLYQSVGGLDLGVQDARSSPSPPTPSTPAAPSPPLRPAQPARAPAAARAPATRPSAAMARRSFYAHLGPYVVVNLFLVMLYLLTSPGGYFWPIWPMMGWGVGLGIHAWAAFVVAGRD